MGTRLLKRAIAIWPTAPISADARCLLVHMAFTARDDDETPRYFARREEACGALGRQVPDAVPKGHPDFDEVERRRRNAFQRLKIVTKELVDAGLIQHHKRGQRHQRAEYLVTIPSPLDAGTSHVPHAGTSDVPHASTSDVPQTVRETYPQGRVGVTRKRSEEQHHVRRASHVRPVERTA